MGAIPELSEKPAPEAGLSLQKTNQSEADLPPVLFTDAPAGGA
ncbi:hypothetical protein SAMN05216456_1047 [Devosia crocina]|uniref:Uncharacterized protein n=1 Tax=Devosia crocina TaxID=429728 RepID=A0A1I7N780_9HYPH|nr:hypothetical protein SAMN05216456_1047 [Devosia crocina]